jgi:plastocyanin
MARQLRLGRASGPMSSLPVRQPLRLLPLALVIAALGAALVVALGGPAVAQAKRTAQIDGTAANQWVPANVPIKPGGTVTFKVAGGQTHPVGSGATPPARDKRFDDSKCQPPQHMVKMGDTCTVRFPKAGTYPFFCEAHYSLGMKGVITVGSAGPTASTTATTAGGTSVVTAAAAAAPPPGHPAIYWAGWGLFAFGALLALVLIGLYVRFTPRFNRQRR